MLKRSSLGLEPRVTDYQFRHCNIVFFVLRHMRILRTGDE
jgi:hypothetical protein